MEETRSRCENFLRTVKRLLLRALPYLVVAVLSVAVTLCVIVARTPVSKLQQLENLILNYYIGEADQTVLEDAAAEALIEALGDRWSYYIPADEYAAYMEQMNNSYVGIGITVEVADGGGFTIVGVNAGATAEAAGLLKGDRILAVDGQSVLETASADLSALVRGATGTTVQLTVERAGAQLDFTVERKEVLTSVATATLLSENVGLVTIENFDSRCYSESVAAIESLLEQGAQSLIFDVRNNPGGYQKELVKLLDYILPEGDLFRSEDYLGNITVDTSDAACLRVPMAVLVNGNSYSAAEFFAAALQEYDYATVIGEPTSGKGYFQSTFRLSDGSAVALSIGRYTTPNGVSLEGVGITPDITVTVSDELASDIYYGRLEPMDDPQIAAAWACLTDAS